MSEDDLPEISLPALWPNVVAGAILQLIALAHFAFVRAVGIALMTSSERLRWQIETARLRHVTEPVKIPFSEPEVLRFQVYRLGKLNTFPAIVGWLSMYPNLYEVSEPEVLRTDVLECSSFSG